jgi:hypothetical protein
VTTPKLSDIKIKALLAGAVVDNMGTLTLMTLLAAALVSTGLTDVEVMRRMKSTSGLLLGLIIGLSCTIAGAYLAGRMARGAEVLHGALVAFIGTVMALIFREGVVPLWFDIAGFAGMLPAGLVGGYLAQKHRESAGGRSPGSG